MKPIKILIYLIAMLSITIIYWCWSSKQTTSDIIFPSYTWSTAEDLITWLDTKEKFGTASFNFSWYVDYKSWDMNIIKTGAYHIPWRYRINQSYWSNYSVSPWYSQQHYWYDYTNCYAYNCYSAETTYIYIPQNNYYSSY